MCAAGSIIPTAHEVFINVFTSSAWALTLLISVGGMREPEYGVGDNRCLRLVFARICYAIKSALQTEMNDKLKNIHIGSEIRKRLDNSGMTYAEFARRIHCERATLYHLFKCKSIDVERLILISEVLRYDFFHELYFHKHGAVDSDDLDSGSNKPRIYIAVELKEESLSLKSLPDGFVELIKK